LILSGGPVDETGTLSNDFNRKFKEFHSDAGDKLWVMLGIATAVQQLYQLVAIYYVTKNRYK
jgi:hypothetical protein